MNRDKPTFRGNQGHDLDTELENHEQQTDINENCNIDDVYGQCPLETRLAHGSHFRSESEAESLYFSYARETGFGVRKDIRLRDTEGNVKCRRWVCSKEGFRPRKYLISQNRKRAARPLTRTGCRAEFRVAYNKQKGAWFSILFIPQHNHDLTPTHHVHYIRSHRTVSEADMAAAVAMTRVGIRPSHIHEYMVQRSGSYSDVGCMRQDVQNSIAKLRRKQLLDSDSESCLAFLQGKTSSDPAFYYEYTIDTSNRLADIFWCDGGSRSDYAIFGDTIAFDATYRTNAYRKPFVVIIGINHHQRTTVFGFALLSGETEHTYTWLLETYLHAMDGKHPVTVLTDGDKAMRNAIEKTFPQATHRLCCWHLERNAQANLHSTSFTNDFKECMLYTHTEEEFENKWISMVQKHKVEQNEWVKKMYSDRHMWAEPYLRGKFFGGMRSTQRCEGLNAYLNHYVNRKLRLIDIVDQMDRMMQRQRELEGKDDFDSSNGKPVLITHLRQYEEQAARIYTKKIFHLVREQLDMEGLMIVKGFVSDISSRRYTISEFRKRDNEWKVVIHQASQLASCSCQLLQSKGIPCCHAFSVLKTEDIHSIPESMQVSRWMKTAKINVMPQNKGGSINNFMSTQARIGSINSACRNLNKYAANSIDAYNEAIKTIHDLTLRLEAMSLPATQSNDRQRGGNPHVIKDPAYVLTKGSQKQVKSGPHKSRKCRRCGQPGHTIRTCKEMQRQNRCHFDGINKFGDYKSDDKREISNSNCSGWSTERISNQSADPNPSQPSQSSRDGIGHTNINGLIDLNLFTIPTTFEQFEQQHGDSFNDAISLAQTHCESTNISANIEGWWTEDTSWL